MLNDVMMSTMIQCCTKGTNSWIGFTLFHPINNFGFCSRTWRWFPKDTVFTEQTTYPRGYTAITAMMVIGGIKSYWSYWKRRRVNRKLLQDYWADRCMRLGRTRRQRGRVRVYVITEMMIVMMRDIGVHCWGCYDEPLKDEQTQEQWGKLWGLVGFGVVAVVL